MVGASGGLGGALARHYAVPGERLLLWGRDAGRLDAIARECRAAGALVEVRSQDLADLPRSLDALLHDDAADPIGLALFAAGLGDIRAEGELVEDAALVAQLAAINFAAPAAMAAALAERMARRGTGRIVLVGSAAGFHPLPFAAAYAGSKAGLARFADALRLAVKPHGVAVTLVSPGFIDSPGGRQVPAPPALLLSPEEAATRVADAAHRRAAHVVISWPFAALRLLDRMLPRPLRDRLLQSLTPASIR
ncbi:SDR family NAD(P)-dependent oxidoreductase [Croceibacterium sp. TMG7-5b_MA50]|uniref:SDR family NAD(P)-dependent oxidoreductase n=1 Tax=Croceibacterium sp. TMG7-5b_MA50 TaxID=3121290 RepID=UPI0032218BF1